jgi:beta-aspartyl-peptidase (threonine type)
MDISFGVVAHGGAGTPKTLSDGCREACLAAFGILERGGSALDAVVEACRIMEDDGRFNAGSGSVLRIDGATVEMDAAVMDSGGNLGMVMNIRDVRNPVVVARAVTLTPHVALAGRGAEAFAKKIGAAPFPGVSAGAIERHKRILSLLEEGRLGEVNPLWRGVRPTFLEGLSCDTIGAIAVDKKGIFAVATSTGGAVPMLIGRVGDVPMIGCGFYAGPSGAVAATGLGEEIIRRLLAKEVYDSVSRGVDVAAACSQGINLFRPEVPVGLIGISARAYAVSSNKPMAHFAMVRERS